MKKLKKPKVRNKNKDLKLQTVLDLFKQEKYELCLTALLQHIEKEKRVRLAVDYLNKSKFKSYNKAMRQFTATIHKYFVNSENTDILKQYEKQYLKYPHPTTKDFSIFYHDFVSVRKCIIKDAIDNNCCVENAFFTILESSTRYDNNNDEYNRLIKSLILTLASIKFENTKMLKILYGEKHEKRTNK